MPEYLSISREHLDTLLRRGHSQYHRGSTTISQADYISLIRQTHEYRCLKAALIAGGASEQTLKVLIDSKNNSIPQETSRKHLGIILDTSDLTENYIGALECENIDTVPAWRRTGNIEQESVKEQYLSLTPVSMVHDAEEEEFCSDRKSPPRNDGSQNKRTITLEGVPKAITLSDIEKFIKGGLIANFYLLPWQHSVQITFVEPKAAEAFLNNSKQNAVLIRGKPLTVSWSNYQEYIPDYVLNYARSGGATRNLVLRSVQPDVTAKSIRDDLDHIHRLEVVGIRFGGGHAWVTLNSIRNAITARNCMKSRKKYQSLRIEFFPDPCNESASPASARSCQLPRPNIMAVPAVPAVLPMANRFGVLLIDSFEEDSDEIADGEDLMSP